MSQVQLTEIVKVERKPHFWRAYVRKTDGDVIPMTAPHRWRLRKNLKDRGISEEDLKEHDLKD